MLLFTLLCSALGLVAGLNLTAETTFYGFTDNCPPGGAISFPTLQHPIAGGLGSWADPITFAGAPSAPGLTPGKTVIYIFSLQKYFRFEDECEECVKDMKRKKWHFDLWMGGYNTNGSALIGCENAMTVGKAAVELDPPATYPVNLTPLFNNVTQQCIVPSTPCTDVGNTCGNSCEIPSSATCPQLATEFFLTYPRFLQLNPSLDSTCQSGAVIPQGTSVCMGGSCGGR